MAFKNHDDAVKQKISFAGNNVKSMRNSVEASLKKLRTSYVDVLYVHWWEYEVSIEEVMSGLQNLVVQGKVLYLVCLVCMNSCLFHQLSLALEKLTREFPILQHGSFPKQTNMPGCPVKLHSPFIKELGQSYNATLNAK